MAGSTIIQLVLRARDEMSNALGSVAGKVAGLIAAFTGAAAITEAVTQLTELDIAARRLGVTVEDLTAAQYAAFKTTGVGAEQLVDALEEVRIKIEEMNSIQSGGAIDFFQIMKTSSAEFMKLNPLEQLQKISDVMKGMSTSAQFTFLDQIGSDNLRNLLPLLQDGSGKMKELMEQAKAAGLTLSSLDAKNVEQMNRSFNELTNTLSTGFKKGVADAAPELQALFEMITLGTTQASSDIDNMGSSGREIWRSVIEAVGNGFARLGRAVDGLYAVLFGLVTYGADFVKFFLLGVDTILDYVGKFAGSFVTFYRQAFADVLSLVANSFVPGIKSLLDKIPGSMASSMSAAMDGVQKSINSYATELSKPVTINLGGMLAGAAAEVDKVSKIADQLGQQATKAFATGEGGTVGAIKGFTQQILARGDELNKANEALVKQDQDRAKLGTAKGGDAKNNLVNTQTAATLAATRAKLAADLAKLEIDKTIESIQTRQQLDQKALDARATAEKLTAGEIADARLAIDLKANREISDQRKASIGEDLKVLQAQLAAQRKVLGQSTIDSERGTALGAIADLEAQITLKRQEQLNLSSALANQEAILRADRASALADSQAQVQAIKDQLEVDLLRIRGSDYKADLLEIEREFDDTKRTLEAMGEDSTAAADLVAAKKAKAELDEIDRQYAALKRKLENNQISSKDYMTQVNALGERGQKAAETTGNQADVDRTKDSLESAKSEVFSFQKTWKDLQSSLSSDGLGDAFTSIIDGSKSAAEAFADMGSAMISIIMRVIAQLLVQYAIQSMIGMFGGGASTAAGAVASGVKHDGGVIGSSSGRSRSVPGWMYGGAMKYHTGGVIGLKPNEVPIIAEKGEEMLTANDPRHRNNLGKGSGNSGSDQPRLTINNMIDAPSIASAMEGPDGERVIMNVVRANRSEIKQM
ncbi:phage tail tape measure protein [Pseudomonas sp. PGPR81]|uniref:phage tail tape measure protein n=1 Tax=Pseudomonas sp. PGPR81 TaxID=2913477 RepID=UPI001EDAD1E6|nr:phage tail tape measure protein [Pseudomonas sp. PGPR81]